MLAQGNLIPFGKLPLVQIPKWAELFLRFRVMNNFRKLTF